MIIDIAILGPNISSNEFPEQPAINYVACWYIDRIVSVL